MRQVVIAASISLVVFCTGASGEERKFERLEALRAETLGGLNPSPRTVTPPASYALSIDGPFDLGGYVFKDGAPFLHNDGGNTYFNTALGVDALISSVPGVPNYYNGRANTAVGASALRDNTTGFFNSATGASALVLNTTGYSNTASGAYALAFNTTGHSNTAVGAQVLVFNSEGYYNTGVGVSALYTNTTGRFNTAIGALALQDNTTGRANTAAGSGALANNTTGIANVANGAYTLAVNSTGSKNTAVGTGALFGTTGSRNTALGYDAGRVNASGSDNIFIASYGDQGESNTLRIGEGTGNSSFKQNRAFISGIRDANLTGVEQDVCVDPQDQVGPCSRSSRRFKEQIRDLGDASGELHALRPVLFKYKPEVRSGHNIEHFGLIAEEVAEVFPTLVSTDAEGRPFTVRYDLLTPLLLNELQKQHRQTRVQWFVIAGMMLCGLVVATRRRFGAT